MDMITYISALLAVFLLLGLFAVVMRQITQGGLRTRDLSRALPLSLRRFLPRALRLQPSSAAEGFVVAAVRMIDARRKIVAIDYGDKRYILLLSHQHEQLLDTLQRETSSAAPLARRRRMSAPKLQTRNNA